MSGIFFTSDPHLGHVKVAELRGFETTEDHDERIIREWSKAVRDGDHVWVLGDLSTSKHEYALGVIDALPGVKHLIAGNHDACHPMHRTARNWQRKYLEVFQSVQAFARIRIDKRDVLLSHFSYNTDRAEIRYPQYRLPDMGKWLLHGHTHGTERLHDGNQIHVGLDAWDLKPVQLGTIVELMKEAE